MGWSQSRSPRYKILLFVIPFLTACGAQNFQFGLLPENDHFEQSSSLQKVSTIDILWVIDNSGSMEDLQTNVANNIETFMQGFLANGYNFQMAVTTTGAWQAESQNDPTLAAFKDGNEAGPTGYPIVTPQTPDLIPVFKQNFLQGVRGTGDERAFQSFRAALDSPLNAGFVRRGGYLAVIIVSDEDDFSNDGTTLNENYNDPSMHPVSAYTGYLDNLTASTPRNRRYSVSGVAIWDQACLDQSGGKIARRYGELVDATGGLKVNVCSPTFGEDLAKLRAFLIEMLTQFPLSRPANEDTIIVYVDEQIVPKDPYNGWTYHSDSNSIRFHGSAVPSESSKIRVAYTPTATK